MPEPSGLTTDLVPEGTVNRYFTLARAQAAAATMFTGSVNSNVVFTYDADSRSLSANVAIPAPTPSGIMSVEQDLAPKLGGDLDLNGHKIIGLPDSIANLEQDTAPYLGGDLHLNNYSINGSGILDISSEGLIPTKITGIVTGGVGNNPWVSINGTRGTIKNPTATLPGDSISGLMFRGYTGNNFYAFAGGIFSSWAAHANLTGFEPECPASNVKLVAGTGVNGGLQFCTFNSQGVLSAPVLQAEPTNIYPADPGPGMIIFNNDDNHFYGWNGSAWRQLDNK